MGLGTPVGLYLLRLLVVFRGRLGPLDFALNEYHVHGGVYLLLTILSSYLLGAIGFYVGAARGWMAVQNEALTQLVDRLTVLQDLNRQISSTLDSGSVFSSVARAAMRLLNGDRSDLFLLTVDGEGLELKATFGSPPTTSKSVTTLPIPGPLETVVREGRPVLVNQDGKSAEWRESDGSGDRGFQACIAVPLSLHNRVAGALVCYSGTPNRFVESDIELMEALSAQAAVALENSRSFDEARQKSEQIARLNEINRTLSRVLEPERVLKRILETSEALVKWVHAGLYLYDDDRQLLIPHPGSFKEWGPIDENSFTIKEGENLSGWVAENRRVLAIPDVNLDSRWIALDWSRGKPRGGYLGLPLLAGDDLLGILACFTEKPHAWSQEEIDLISSFASQAAVAIHNAQLHERLAMSEEHYRTVAETATDGVISMDARGEITFINRAAQRMFGYSADEALGMPAADLISERFRPHASDFQRLIETRDFDTLCRTHALEGVRKDRSVFSLEVSASASEVSGRFQITGIYRDITQRKRVQELSMRNEKLAAIGRMTAGAAHEILNPVSRGYAKLS